MDTLLSLILLLTMLTLPISTWLMSTYIRDIPLEIEDAAFVDGCSRWRLLFSIIMPLARPGMVAVFLVALLTTWNNFFIPLIFTGTASSQPIKVVLSLFIGQYEVAWEAKAGNRAIFLLKETEC